MDKYKIQEHVEKVKEYIIYQVAPNGEVCKRVASCNNIDDATNILNHLNNKD